MKNIKAAMIVLSMALGFESFGQIKSDTLILKKPYSWIKKTYPNYKIVVIPNRPQKQSFIELERIRKKLISMGVPENRLIKLIK